MRWLQCPIKEVSADSTETEKFQENGASFMDVDITDEVNSEDDEAAMEVDDVEAEKFGCKFCLKELETKNALHCHVRRDHILAKFETTFTALMDKHPNLVHETLKTHVIVSHNSEDIEDTGESMFKRNEEVVESAHSMVFQMQVNGNYKTKRFGPTKDKRNLKTVVKSNSITLHFSPYYFHAFHNSISVS